MTWDERYQKEMPHRLQRRLVKMRVPDSETLIKQLVPRIDQIIDKNSQMIVDEQTRPHLRLVACVLACYQELAASVIGQSEAYPVIEEIFTSIGRTMLRLFTQALMSFSRDPFSALTKAGRQRVSTQYGKAWEFTFEETPQTFIMTATRCFYLDFFKTNNMPQLTRIFCRWDMNWIGVIDPRKHRMEFERPTTMAFGGGECPFIFRRLPVM